MVKLYMICRDCETIEYVGLGDITDDLELKISKSDYLVNTILKFLVEHEGHNVSLVTQYTVDAEGLLLWRKKSKEEDEE